MTRAELRATLIFAAAIIAALAVLAIFPIDHDPGPAQGSAYPPWDRWSAWHLAGSAIIAIAACAIRVSWYLALTMTVAAGMGWELVNGHVDGWDVVWDAAGAAVGVLLYRAFRRVRSGSLSRR